METIDDVCAAIAALGDLVARGQPLDLSRLLMIGHSVLSTATRIHPLSMKH